MKLKKPPWITTTVDVTSFQDLIGEIKRNNLHVVCYEASCPNIGTCFQKRTATFLILGDTCTRTCAFCGIKHGKSSPLDPDEPKEVAKLVDKLNLRHAVITSVTRDDLADQGVNQFINTLREIRKIRSKTIIEVLIPDFQGDKNLLNQLILEKPDIINHNMETVSRLYPQVRPQASYTRSLGLLQYIKKQKTSIYTKSGFMIGVGEAESEILALMQDLKNVKCDVLTIGQYLSPSERHLPVKGYYTPEEFKRFEEFGKQLGFLSVSAAPLVRSSFNAVEFSDKFLC